MLKEFKEFAMRGNVLDLAVGVIIGAAFGKVVSSLVEDVIMPPLGRLLGHVDFSNLFINLSDKSYEYPGGRQSRGRTHAQLRQLHQHHHQFPDRGFRRVPVGALGEQMVAESPGTRNHQGLPAVRDAHSGQRQKVRPLHQRGLEYSNLSEELRRSALLRGFFFRLASRWARSRANTASSCPSSISFCTSSSAKCTTSWWCSSSGAMDSLKRSHSRCNRFTSLAVRFGACGPSTL